MSPRLRWVGGGTETGLWWGLHDLTRRKVRVDRILLLSDLCCYTQGDVNCGVNLSQRFPDFPAPAVVKDAACAAIQGDVNQYAVTWGTRALREAIAREFGRRYGVTVVPDEQVVPEAGGGSHATIEAA